MRRKKNWEKLGTAGAGRVSSSFIERYKKFVVGRFQSKGKLDEAIMLSACAYSRGEEVSLVR
jgi:hypothetical protein